MPASSGSSRTDGLSRAMAFGAECSAPLGAHGNIAKLAAVTYGQAISQLEMPGEL